MNTSSLILTTLLLVGTNVGFAHAGGERWRELGIHFLGETGNHNAITDVPGVMVGHVTLCKPEGEEHVISETRVERCSSVQQVSQDYEDLPASSVRTGVTAIVPGLEDRAFFAAITSFNGSGELTGAHFIQENGYFLGPIILTNTVSVGTVHSAIIEWTLEDDAREDSCCLSIVGETYDGYLNDIFGSHVTNEHVFDAIEYASDGPVPEGNVGAGNGTISFNLKAGIGTSSRRVILMGENEDEILEEYILGVIVQANYGDRAQLRIDGVPAGELLTTPFPQLNNDDDSIGQKDSSIVAILATNAPLLPHQLQRLSNRIALGIARTGGIAANDSGELFLAFSTYPSIIDNSNEYDEETDNHLYETTFLSDDYIDEFFAATVQATEEAVINSLLAAETMRGNQGNVAYSIDHEELKRIMRQFRRLQIEENRQYRSSP